MKQKDILLQAIHQELEERKAYLQGQTVETVYFGGGTPSLLSSTEILEIWAVINKNFQLKDNLEVTLEANPDDLTKAHLQSLKATPINRFSIGIQSFFEEDLLFMNRAHDAAEAKACIVAAQEAGFHNLTIDLIYGTPTTSHERWKQNLEMAFALQIPHISCYALTVEPKTALAHQIKAGKTTAVSDSHSAEQFEILLELIQKNGYEQYEISNFCKAPHYAQHNSNYWTGKHYLGVGPSAHSFNGVSRQWNLANNPKYINALTNRKAYWEAEILTPENQYNEYIMTALRTKWGVDSTLLSNWGEEILLNFQKTALPFINKGLMKIEGTVYTLTDKGKFIADSILSELFLI